MVMAACIMHTRPGSTVLLCVIIIIVLSYLLYDTVSFKEESIYIVLYCKYHGAPQR